MALFDMPLADLRTYRPPASPPADLAEFWRTTLDEARRLAPPPKVVEVDTPMRRVTTYDVTFGGFGAHPIKAWLTVPVGVPEPMPLVVEYIGYTGGRGLPHECLQWPAAGYAQLTMDTRGQGASWRRGDTPDPGPDGSGPSVPGFLTRGVLDPQTYYYRRLFTDAVRAVEIADELPGVDPQRVAVAGGSQGGGLALAAASLAPERIRAVVSSVPFLCHIRRAATITDSEPYVELARFCRANPDRADRVFATIDYIDVMHLVPRATAPALFSAALMDAICPPSTVFAAYQAYAGPKEIEVYEWDGHEGGRAFFQGRALQFVTDHLG